VRVQIRLYFDEDSMRRALVRALRARGVDVITALEAGMIERGDAEHLNYATEQGRVLCTFNVGDFYRLHTEYVTEGRTHAGIVLMSQQRFSIGEQMRRLLRLIASRSADEMEGWVEFLSEWG
jgi:predicted nuclease of predicted toxin-antitoxin system